MKHYSYVVARDFGFAPNPFGRYCTLATCKPRIRKNADIGSWIFGITPRDKGAGNKLVFAMKVTQKMTFNEYWESPDFQYKKPVLNGSLKQMYGDNIYHKDDNGNWFQADSHHSKEGGEINKENLNRDTKGEFVLISDCFYYFGASCINIPTELKKEIIVGIGQKQIDGEFVLQIVEWLEAYYQKGLTEVPKLFTGFKRYDGVS
ncbi:hypothetical protein EYV94_26020 [Puteibacter caeruleilacunae]|nr:hypothetical protein EYV94_26020 [Puteibacter caeruleilacunae]